MIVYMLLTLSIVQSIVQSILHIRERRDLYNRIMSRDFTEYKGQPIHGNTQSAHDRVLKRWRSKGGD